MHLYNYVTPIINDNVTNVLDGFFSYPACLVWDKFYFVWWQIHFSVLLILRPFQRKKLKTK